MRTHSIQNILKVFLFFSVSAIVLFTTHFAAAYTPLPGSPLANRSHPRLLITQASIPTLRTAIAANYADKFQEYVDWAANPGTSKGGIGEVQHDPLRSYIVHQAFIYAMRTVPAISYPISPDAFGRLAIANLLKSLRGGSGLGYAAVLTYDWTYNIMTDGERSEITNLMLSRKINHPTLNNSIANPNTTPDRLFSSKYYEGLYSWYFGLAFWGDGLIDAQADAAMMTFYDVMLNYGNLDALNFVSEQSGGWSQWGGYSSWHPRTHMMLVNGWRTATGENYVARQELGKINGNAIGQYAKFIQYALDPHKYNKGYSYIRMGGAEMDEIALTHRSVREQLFYMPRMLDEAGLSSDAGLVRNFIDKYEAQWPTYKFFYLYGFLGVPSSIPAVTPDQRNLPHSLWSKNSGVFFARTGFNNPADGVFTVRDSHFRFDGHSGPDDDPGFSLNKFGPLVNTQQVAHRGYGNLWKYIGGEKKNIVYFEGDHGKLHFKSEWRATDLERASKGLGDYDWGGIEQVTVRDKKFYNVRVNRSRMFVDGVDHTREYVWLAGDNPSTDSDFLVVYDRTTAPTKPRWIYHVPWKPDDVLNETSFVDLTTGSGETDRIGTAYTGSNIIIKELNSVGGEKDNNDGTLDFTGGSGSHGVAFGKTLLPKNARVEVTRVAQFDVQVLNRQHELAIKTGRWQVAVLPTDTTSTDQRFLHVFETGDANLKTSMSNTSLIEVGNQMQGTWIERENSNRPNYVVLFNKEEGARQDIITYTVSGNGLVRHVLTGLKANTNYQITEISSGTTQNKPTETSVQSWDYKGVDINSTTGTVYFESTISGTHSYRLTPSGTVEDTISPNIPSNFRISRLFQK